MKRIIPTLFLLIATISLSANPDELKPIEKFLKENQLPPAKIEDGYCKFKTPSYEFLLSLVNGQAVFSQDGNKLPNPKEIIAFIKFCAQEQKNQESLSAKKLSDESASNW